MTHVLERTELEAQLNDFRPDVRAAAVGELLRRHPTAPVPPAEMANMHCHTFFSFNAYGYSPTGLAWLGRSQGYQLMGIVDFDVLDGVDEFLAACDQTGVRGSAGIETRVYLPEFEQYEMNSPGEPGVLYHMGIGFATTQVGPEAAALIAELRGQSAARNQGLIERVNTHLAPVTIDYAADVLPLTPAGNATERHIVVAYLRAAETHYADAAARTRFWAGKLQMAEDAVATAMNSTAGFQNLVRAKLMKQGGVGYVQPGHDTFPPIDKLHAMILACGALPCAAWLDGTTSGEERIEELLDLLVGKGAVALNIVPDRNWDIKDPATRELKVRKLYAVVELARALDLPLNIGTEMNSFGQKLVDDFTAPALQPVRQDFIDGAYFIYGHTVLQRRAGLGYQSAWAASYLPTRRDRNQFYIGVGRAVPPGASAARLLQGVSEDMTPGQLLAHVQRG
ncbi:MAG: hypothetical protein DCC57_12290 [Chloroflexi bacterium]|nr:MAG: hypothetical protein DCC57_12290 [Chloroflexota bacterium]